VKAYRALRRQRRGACSTERARQLGEDRQIGMEPNPLDPSHAEGEKRPLILEPAELALADWRVSDCTPTS